MDYKLLENYYYRLYEYFLSINNTSLVIGASSVILIAVTTSMLIRRQILIRKYGKNYYRNLGSLRLTRIATDLLAKQLFSGALSDNIHGIGVGFLSEDDEYCVQLFVKDPTGVSTANIVNNFLPKRFQSQKIVVIEMEPAVSLSCEIDGIKNFTKVEHEQLRPGISVGNEDLSDKFGSLGCFCTRRSILSVLPFFSRKSEVYLLSNTHVLTDVKKLNDKTVSKAILQPAPGDHGNKMIGEIISMVPFTLHNSESTPNLADAAIARIKNGKDWSNDIPQIGTPKGWLRKESIVLESECRKFGRTTCLSKGRIISVHCLLSITYSGSANPTFFAEQILIEPTDETWFGKGGDSGSVVVDNEGFAIGILFAGPSDKSIIDKDTSKPSRSHEIRKIERYGAVSPMDTIVAELGITIKVNAESLRHRHIIHRERPADGAVED